VVECCQLSRLIRILIQVLGAVTQVLPDLASLDVSCCSVARSAGLLLRIAFGPLCVLGYSHFHTHYLQCYYL
jgi:hypothetical protein